MPVGREELVADGLTGIRVALRASLLGAGSLPGCGPGALAALHARLVGGIVARGWVLSGRRGAPGAGSDHGGGGLRAWRRVGAEEVAADRAGYDRCKGDDPDDDRPFEHRTWRAYPGQYFAPVSTITGYA